MWLAKRVCVNSAAPPGLDYFFHLYPALEALGYFRSPLRGGISGRFAAVI